MKIPIKLVFDDWRRVNPATLKQESVYETPEGVELTVGDFHHGATFNATIEVDEDEAAKLASFWGSGAIPVFHARPKPCVYTKTKAHRNRKYVTGPLET